MDFSIKSKVSNKVMITGLATSVISCDTVKNIRFGFSMNVT